MEAKHLQNFLNNPRNMHKMGVKVFQTNLSNFALFGDLSMRKFNNELSSIFLQLFKSNSSN